MFELKKVLFLYRTNAKKTTAMKQNSLLLTLFFIGLSFTASAQHKTVVYGSLGVSNVNIGIVNMRNGTSSNAGGHYAL